MFELNENTYTETSIWRYRVLAEQCFNIDVGLYNTYGMQVTGAYGEEILHDVSVCHKTVSLIAEVFNQYQLSPIHLHDVVEDMLSQLESYEVSKFNNIKQKNT